MKAPKSRKMSTSVVKLLIQYWFLCSGYAPEICGWQVWDHLQHSAPRQRSASRHQVHVWLPGRAGRQTLHIRPWCTAHLEEQLVSLRACASCERAWLAIFDCWFVFCWHWCCSVGTILDSKPTNMEHFSLLVQQNAPRLYFSLPVLVSNHSRLLVQCVCSLMHWCGISAH